MIGNNSNSADSTQFITDYYNLVVSETAKTIYACKFVIPAAVITGIALSILFPPYAGLSLIPVIAFATYSWMQSNSVKKHCETVKLNSDTIKECVEASQRFIKIDLKERTKEKRQIFAIELANMERSIEIFDTYLSNNQLDEPKSFKELQICFERCKYAFQKIYYKKDSDDLDDLIDESDSIPELREPDQITAKEFFEVQINQIDMCSSILLRIQRDDFSQYLHAKKFLYLSPLQQKELLERKLALDQMVFNSPTRGGDDDIPIEELINE